ncbi:hypothetical protein [Rhizobium tumorigenes]|uniref:Uncharacterized protein n=1 Tax=Rhizobium tumorigenes TaxID=2041385 RepID=A0AAF1KHY4_9HYPH|nr:hypothetical protein [Rhizobium tumorigenes]WFR96528.1 hypothetical protein PR017_05200 [Rhizobium tumorigenes]
MLVTILGLFAASILPTVSLLINSMSAAGRSVHAVNQLQKELQAAIDALFFIFGCVIVAVGALLSLLIEPAAFMTRVPYLTSEILPRAGQAIVCAATGLVIWRAGQIPAILRRSLKVRYEIAVSEARSKVDANVPAASQTKQAFATHPDFGKVVSLQELQGPEKRS